MLVVYTNVKKFNLTDDTINTASSNEISRFRFLTGDGLYLRRPRYQLGQIIEYFNIL